MRRPLVLVGFLTAARWMNGAPVAQCRGCHPAQTRGFDGSAMKKALEPAAEAVILSAHPVLRTEIGGYRYEIARSGSAVMYTVSDGKGRVQFPILWAFGQGTAGQTYLYANGGRWYESRVSYFGALQGLDLTMGAQSIHPANLEEAAGRLTSNSEAGQCFDCHATNVIRTPLKLDAMTPGVQCERCHGSAPGHPGTSPAPMKKLGRLSTEELSDFCGQCHRTWSQVAANGPRGIQNVRFQPYRLAGSKCYDAADARIRCTACHDPHTALETRTVAYDIACKACHTKTARLPTKATGHICRVGTKDCVSCHMPKLELPGAHNQFTDHRIRIARAGGPYPD